MNKAAQSASRKTNAQSKSGDLRCADPTPAEAELEQFLNRLGNGVLAGEFIREWPIGDWTVDFYFPANQLAIEVDGGYHRAQSRWRKDLQKTADLKARGITVLRLVNAEVFGDRERLTMRLRVAWQSAQRQAASQNFSVEEPRALPYFAVTPPILERLANFVLGNGEPQERTLTTYRCFTQPYENIVRSRGAWSIWRVRWVEAASLRPPLRHRPTG